MRSRGGTGWTSRSSSLPRYKPLAMSAKRIILEGDGPKNARKARAAPPSRVEVPDDVREDVLADEEPLDVDVEAHLRWLETGKGEPWPRARRG